MQSTKYIFFFIPATNSAHFQCSCIHVFISLISLSKTSPICFYLFVTVSRFFSIGKNNFFIYSIWAFQFDVYYAFYILIHVIFPILIVAANEFPLHA